MAQIASQVASPQDLQSASLIVDWLVSNPTRHGPVLADSLRLWDRKGCHVLAQAIKGDRRSEGGSMLAAMLRQTANRAIILEHRLATR